VAARDSSVGGGERIYHRFWRFPGSAHSSFFQG
jgi:hypothetical protein